MCWSFFLIFLQSLNRMGRFSSPYRLSWCIYHKRGALNANLGMMFQGVRCNFKVGWKKNSVKIHMRATVYKAQRLVTYSLLFRFDFMCIVCMYVYSICACAYSIRNHFGPLIGQAIIDRHSLH